MKKILIFLWLTICGAPPLLAQTTLIPFGSRWQYLDNGSDQGTNWKEASFNDASWKSGAALLGYGNGDENKVVGYGGDEEEKHITTYFRKTFSVANPSGFTGYRVSIKRDDGAVVYINGKEVYRTNMPGGNITYLIRANAHALKNGSTPVKKSLPAGVLQAGSNVIAVEVHQATRNSADMVFDLELTAAEDAVLPPGGDGGGNDGGGDGGVDAELTRGPYLLAANQSAVTLRWRTDDPTDSKIEVGATDSTYTLSATNPLVTTEHEVRISGLKPDTRYYYRFGSSNYILQGGSDNFFRTAPPATATRKIRIAVFGDCGKDDKNNQAGTLKTYQEYVGGSPAELMLLLGDNAYMDGKDAEYQKYFFNVYSPNLLRNHVVFPAPGNHDYHTTSRSARTAPYFRNFSMPTQGECGGLPSGTKAYYSFDWGNIHFLSLDSYGTEPDGTRLYDTLGRQVTWVKKDLEANTREWVVVYFHHPPYSKGTHDADDEIDMSPIREHFIRILERYGVDLVLSGHSHNYERSYLLNGYYGKETGFKAALHARSNSSGRYNGLGNSCPYLTYAGPGNKGTVYVVAGSAGASGSVTKDFPHKAMPYSIDDGGMFYLEVQDNRLTGRFLRKNGKVADQFTIMHDVNQKKEITAARGASVKLTASWVGDYNWSTGDSSRSITVSREDSRVYKVADGLGCLVDSFAVAGAGKAATLKAEPSGEAEGAAMAFKLYPTLVRQGQEINIQSGSRELSVAVVLDNNGRVVRSLSFRGNTTLDTGTLPAGTYFLKLKGAGKVPAQRFVVAR